MFSMISVAPCEIVSLQSAERYSWAYVAQCLQVCIMAAILNRLGSRRDRHSKP